MTEFSDEKLIAMRDDAIRTVANGVNNTLSKKVSLITRRSAAELRNRYPLWKRRIKKFFYPASF